MDARRAGSPHLKRAAGLLLFALSAGAALALTGAARRISPLDPSKELDDVAAQAARDTIAEFADKGLTEDGISIALIDLTEPGPSPSFPAGGFRADVAYYPCSVIKIFFLAYYETEKAAGRLKDTPELQRAVKDMITLSYNDATGFVVDSITGTTSGPELSGREWEDWKNRRNAVNRFYAKRGGFPTLNANQKTFCEDAYGREQAFREDGQNRNRMSPAEAARMFKEIFRGEVVGTAGTDEMTALLSRDITGEKPLEEMEPEDARLAGERLPKGSRLWAKSGDAYDFHHLVGRVVLPNGADFVIAVFTKGVKTVPGVVPSVYGRVAAHFAARRISTPG
ncbi:MAG TPA: serine hydrolase [Thermoanaerobaculia bacterium]